MTTGLSHKEMQVCPDQRRTQFLYLPTTEDWWHFDLFVYYLPYGQTGGAKKIHAKKREKERGQTGTYQLLLLRAEV